MGVADPRLLRLLRARLIAFGASRSARGEAAPLGGQPPPRQLEPRAAKAADAPAFGCAGAAREAAIILMKDDFIQTMKSREKADEIFKGEMLRKMSAVEKDLEIETRARVASEEQLVNALNDYTRALQDGLRIVNRAV